MRVTVTSAPVDIEGGGGTAFEVLAKEVTVLVLVMLLVTTVVAVTADVDTDSMDDETRESIEEGKAAEVTIRGDVRVDMPVNAACVAVMVVMAVMVEVLLVKTVRVSTVLDVETEPETEVDVMTGTGLTVTVNTCVAVVALSGRMLPTAGKVVWSNIVDTL